MAQVPVPEEVAQLLVKVTHELWSPGQVIHRMRSGALDGPLLRAERRWRGTVEFSAWAAFGDPAWDVDRVAAVDLFFARMSQPENHCIFPWGGPAPLHRIPDVNWRGTITVAETEDAGFTVRRTAGSGGFRVGDWLSISQRACIVREANAPNGAVQTGLRTVPDIDPVTHAGATTPVYAGDEMCMRFTPNGDATLRSQRMGGLAGPWTLVWEEYLG